jgi:very-short-patch-repair endonuclease
MQERAEYKTNQNQMPKDWVHNARNLRDRRRDLRKNSTTAESWLWYSLRDNKLGVKFRRQHSIGGYIADFYCQKTKLIIELDGGIHNTVESKEYDKIRDKYFIELGYKVLRFKNIEVENNLGNVLSAIQAHFRVG